MFLTAPVIWLQSWASPGLTHLLEAISWFGYTRVAIGLAVVFAFAFRLRAGMALLLLLGLNSLATDLAKTAAAMPRPFVVDRDVRILGWPSPETTARAGEAANAADSEAGFGFPSGHVSTAVTFAAGLATLVGGRWLRVTGAAWVALMALSRLYLGRHFIGDVLGGVAVGAVIVGLGVTVLRLRALAESPVARDGQRAALLNALIAAMLLAAALVFGRPDPGDTGRLAGIALAVLVLTRAGVMEVPPQVLTRAGLVILAALSYALVWGTLTTAGSRVASSLLPAFAMVCVPAVLINRSRATTVAGRSA